MWKLVKKRVTIKCILTHLGKFPVKGEERPVKNIEKIINRLEGMEYPVNEVSVCANAN